MHDSSTDRSTPARAFAELGRTPVVDPPLGDTLRKIALLTCQTIAAADAVSITEVDRNHATTVAHTGSRALMLDQSQYRVGCGPCMDAARGGQIVTINDMAVETRWPGYTPKALAQGIQSSLSIPLPVQHRTIGSLTLYASRPTAFDEQAVELALAFAGYAAIAIANAFRPTSTPQLIDDMRAVMQSRAIVDQALGVLIGQHGGTAEEALGDLTRMSQEAHRSLRDTAEELVLGVQRPTAPSM
ncbi:GAF and ANTAR domain-containing protein [Cryptosporangium aurantiacum]|uniref:GAF domain-containing protein n=1 Tax=Cryptosporangium aurantiacum TaxID=134849 RepID=A0A1M7RNL1_9ACTN|nr:GAF and ANTAR domain-containing protein [Cryptosporangium aurantiacum]SHN47648.1 GAF domain-containing protein [Cryptosporangium aurantiacum]